MCLQVPEPMDLPTVLARLDAKQYQAPDAFLADVGGIVQARAPLRAALVPQLCPASTRQ